MSAPAAANSVSADLRAAVAAATPRLLSISESRSAERPAPGKWSPREVIGHLIDSASNNHRRFVEAQLSEDLVFPGYAQEKWVAAQRYQDAPWPELVALWRGFNLQLARVIEAAPEEARRRPRATHNLDQIAWRGVPRSEPATLEYFMSDYVAHLRHHLGQIAGAS